MVSFTGDGVVVEAAEALTERKIEGREVAMVVEEGRGVERKGFGRSEIDILGRGRVSSGCPSEKGVVQQCWSKKMLGLVIGR